MTGGTGFGDYDNETAVPGYVLGKSDTSLLTVAGRLLEHAMLAPGTDWAIKVSVAKLMHVFSRLPNESAELNVEVAFSSLPALAAQSVEEVQTYRPSTATAYMRRTRPKRELKGPVVCIC